MCQKPLPGQPSFRPASISPVVKQDQRQPPEPRVGMRLHKMLAVKYLGKLRVPWGPKEPHGQGVELGLRAGAHGDRGGKPGFPPTIL